MTEGENRIGQWVVRVYDARNYHTTTAHHVESVIADRFVTNCGRQMPAHTEAKPENHLEFYATAEQVVGTRICKLCQ